ncbi:MAG: ATP-binding cassette domain-containing protein [Gammaproteobacteria bacterium]|nr:ATP-binding cassette domain-containing protein [Gammaproteobacteria bacterium]
MLSFTNFALRRGTQLLFEHASFTVHQGYKLGITGANGCGKSSLFALLLGKIQGDEGEIDFPSHMTIAHVAQETPAIDRSAIDYVLDGDKELRLIQEKLKMAEEDEDGHSQAELHHQLDIINAYSANSRAARLMQGLGFKNTELDKPVSNFSGGWRMRLNLCQALMCRSDILLLDEPTNHLDLDAVIWLENWLLSYSGTLLLVSHDRDFLDRIVDHVLHIEHQKVKMYTGNYSDFEKRRAEQLAQQQVMYDKQQREVEHIKSFVARFKAKASKAKQAQSRVKALERMELISQAHIDSPFSFVFFEPKKMPHPLLTLDEVSIGYGSNEILKGVSLSLLPGDRIGLLGHNGAGKSTLIKCLSNELKPLSGDSSFSTELKIGYFAQHQVDQLDMDASACLHMQRLDPAITEQEIRNYLGGFNFHGDKVMEPVAPFSGGEKARLALALIIYLKPNLLLLDEPTNHLDLEMRHALSMALQDYEGAMILVSHDRHLLRSVTDSFLLVDDGRLQSFRGDLDEYRQWLIQEAKDKNLPDIGEPSGLSKKEVRKMEAEKRQLLQPLKKRLARLEARITELEDRKQAIETELADSEIYDVARQVYLQDILKEQGEVIRELTGLEEEWLIVSEELDA